jgi:hypothetical protein
MNEPKFQQQGLLDKNGLCLFILSSLIMNLNGNVSNSAFQAFKEFIGTPKIIIFELPKMSLKSWRIGVGKKTKVMT